MAPARAADGAPVLLVASPQSYRIAAYLEAARRLGVPLLVATEGEHALVDALAPGLHVSLHAADALERITAGAGEAPFAAVVAADDGVVELAGRVARRLGLPHNPPGAARVARRKDLARLTQAQAGLPVPRFRRVCLRRDLGPQLAGLPFPCVVKPLALSGSRGVIRADDPESLAAACRRVEAILATAATGEERDWVLVESFIPGPEVALEGMLRDGRLEVLALFDKPDPLDGPFFEETYYVTPSRHPPALRERVVARVAEACRAYGLRQGPVHAEARLHQGDAWLLEMAARTIGGQCARLLRFGTGRGLEELVLARAVGRREALEPMAGAAGVLMIPIPRGGILRRVEGVLDALAVPGVEDLEISLRPGYELVPLPEGSSYLGFIFARAPDPEVVEMSLRAAHACLRVVTAPVLTRQPAGAR